MVALEKSKERRTIYIYMVNQWLWNKNPISLLTLNTTLSQIKWERKKGTQCIKDSENWISSNLVSIFFIIPCGKKLDECVLSANVCLWATTTTTKISSDFHHPLLNYWIYFWCCSYHIRSIFSVLLSKIFYDILLV